MVNEFVYLLLPAICVQAGVLVIGASFYLIRGALSAILRGFLVCGLTALGGFIFVTAGGGEVSSRVISLRDKRKNAREVHPSVLQGVCPTEALHGQFFIIYSAPLTLLYKIVGALVTLLCAMKMPPTP